MKCCVGEIRKRDRERDRNKQYELRMLMHFGINLMNYLLTLTYLTQEKFRYIFTSTTIEKCPGEAN